MSYDSASAFRHVLQLLLSPVVDPFRRYLDICEDVHMRDANRNTMLHWAAAVGNVTAAYELLQHGLEVDARNVYGATPLLVAAAFCPNVGIMGPLLLQHGASLKARVNSVNQDGVPSLLTARGLTPLWTWLSAMKAMMQDSEDNTAASHLRPDSTVALPAAALVNAAAPLLCAPEEIRQLSSGRPVPTKPAGGAAAAPQMVPIPRAPTWQRTLQGGHNPESPSTTTPVTAFPVARLSSTSQVTVTAPSPHPAAQPAREAEREREVAVSLIEARESAGRLQVEEQLEAFLKPHLELLSGWASIFTGDGADEGTPGWSTSSRDGGAASEEDAMYAGLVRCIHTVLGEKCGPDGRRYVLVQYARSPQKTAPSAATAVSEVWCPLSAVAADPVVAAHVDRCSRSYTLTSSAGRAAAATPSILLGDGIGGTPMDTLEREQLEKELRLLPRRDLSSQGSLSSIIAAAKPFSAAHPLTNLPAVPERESWPESSRGVAHLVTTGGRAPSPGEASTPVPLSASVPPTPTRAEEDAGRPSWRFARRAVEEAEPAPDRWSATAPSRTAGQSTLSGQTTRKEERTDVTRPAGAAATCPATATATKTAVVAAASAVASAAPEPTLVLPAPIRNVNALRLESSLDTDPGTSAPASTTHTQGPLSNRGGSDEGSASTDRRYHLSETQRAKYNSYLRDAALQRLHKRQSQLSSNPS